jgi:hypothetical protein
MPPAVAELKLAQARQEPRPPEKLSQHYQAMAVSVTLVQTSS